MTVAPPADPRDVQDFQFKLLCRLRIFSGGHDGNFTKSVNLVAPASKYGLIFVGSLTSLQVIRLASISALDHRSGEISNYPRRELQLPSQATHLGISCEQNYLVVGITKDGCAHGLVYSVPSFAAKNVVLVSEVRLSSKPDTSVLDLIWNPGIGNMLAACLADGSLAVYEVKPPGLDISTQPPATQATCLCWSPKGKQLVVGTEAGTLTQYKPDLKSVKTIQAPNFGSGSVAVVNVLWISNYQFAAIYQDKINTDERPGLLIVNASKTGTVTFVNYEDICYSGGELRSPQFYLIHQPAWNIVMVASANSMEVGVLGLQEDLISWEQWTQEDAARAELPLTSDKQETFPVGMGLDTSSQNELPWGENQSLPPMPVLHILSHQGVLCLFHAVNLKPDAARICLPPEKLSDESGLALFTTSPAGGMQIPPAPIATPPQLTAAPSLFPQVPSLTGMSGLAVPALSFGSDLPAPTLGLLGSSPTGFSASTPVASTGTNNPSSMRFGTGLVNQSNPPSVSFSFSSSSTTVLESMSTFQIATTSAPAPSTKSAAMQGATNFSFVASGSTSTLQPILKQTVVPVKSQSSLFALEQPPSLTKVPSKPDVPPAVSTTVLVNAINEEITHFERELAELQSRVTAVKVEVGRDEEKRLLCQKVDMIDGFWRDLKETTQAQSSEIHSLKSDLLETFAWTEEAKSRAHQLSNPMYMQLTRSQSLDPITARCSSNIKHLVYYVENQLRQVNQQLDSNWLEFQESCKPPVKNKMHIPTLEAVYQAMVMQNSILHKQQLIMADIARRAQERGRSTQIPLISTAVLARVRDKEASQLDKGETELSRLAENLVKLKLGPPSLPIARQCHCLSRKKELLLRELLSQSTVTHICTTKPVQSVLGGISAGKPIITKFDLPNAVEKPFHKAAQELDGENKTQIISLVSGKSSSPISTVLSNRLANAKSNITADNLSVTKLNANETPSNSSVGQFTFNNPLQSGKTAVAENFSFTARLSKVPSVGKLSSTSKKLEDYYEEITPPGTPEHSLVTSKISTPNTNFTFNLPTAKSNILPPSSGVALQKSPLLSLDNIVAGLGDDSTSVKQGSTENTGAFSFASLSLGQAGKPEESKRSAETFKFSLSTFSTPKSTTASTGSGEVTPTATDISSKMPMFSSFGIENQQPNTVPKVNIFGGSGEGLKPSTSFVSTGSSAGNIFAQTATSLFGGLNTGSPAKQQLSTGNIFGAPVSTSSLIFGKQTADTTTATPSSTTDLEFEQKKSESPQNDKIPASSTNENPFSQSTSLFGSLSMGTPASTAKNVSNIFGGNSTFSFGKQSIFSENQSPGFSFGKQPTLTENQSANFSFGKQPEIQTSPADTTENQIQKSDSMAKENQNSSSAAGDKKTDISEASSSGKIDSTTNSVFSFVQSPAAPVPTSMPQQSTATVKPLTAAVFDTAGTGAATIQQPTQQSVTSVTTQTSTITSSTFTFTLPSTTQSSPFLQKTSIFGQANISTSPATATSADNTFFGQPICSPSGIGQGGGSIFGQATSTAAKTNIFGQSATTTSPPTVFGQAATTSSTPTVFGQASATTNAPSLFGQITTTTSAPTVFGQAAATTSAPTVFGQAAATTSVPTVFGETVTTTSAPTVFEQAASTTSAPTVFGQTAATTNAPTVFEQAASTTSAPTVFGQTAATTSAPTVFEQAASTTSAPAVFGQNTATTSAPTVFGQAAATTSAPTVFGQAAATTSAPTVFGQTAATISAPTVFGQTAATTSAPTVFGQATATTSAPTVFGQAAATTNAPTVFGQGAATTSAPTVFGQASPTTSVPTVFGQAAATTSTPTVFGQTAASTSQSIFGQSSSTPLFGQASSGSSFLGGSSGGFGSKPTFGQSGGSIFGQSGSSSFGSGGGSIFGGGGATAGTSVFGGGSGSPSGNLFQSSTGGSIFGGASSPGTGGAFSSGMGQSISQSGFSSPTAFQNKAGGFGGSPVFDRGVSGFGSAPTFGGSPTFANPGKVFGSTSPASNISFGGAGQQQSNTFESLATQNTMTFGNIAQNQSQGFGSPTQSVFGSSPQAQPSSTPSFSSSAFGGSSFSSWR